MCTCVCFAAGTVLTMRKQLHPTLRGQDHALTRNHLQSPSKKGHFQHRCECGWKRKQRVSIGGFLCPQKALSDKVGHIFHISILLVYSAFCCTNLDAKVVDASSCVLFTISERWLGPVLEHEYRQKEEGGSPLASFVLRKL